MSPAVQKEAEETHRKLQELQDEMDRLQNNVKMRKLFEDDEVEELSNEGEKTDDDEDDDKEGTSWSDDEKTRKTRDEEQKTSDRISRM